MIRAMVLERFGERFVPTEFDGPRLEDGEVLVRILAAGVCGSDLYIWKGRDPRVPLPIILGHEGVGRVAAVAGTKRDLDGKLLQLGDMVVWNRGVSCKTCYQCVVRRKPGLCPNRKVYGISLPCDQRPYLLGTYSEATVLLAGVEVLKVGGPRSGEHGRGLDPAELVAATCSGATAAHAIEVANIQPGDTVVVMGPGPLGIFCTAMAREAGAGNIVAFGTKAWKLEKTREFGATHLVNVNDSSPDERAKLIEELTCGRGAEVVIDTVGRAETVAEGLDLAARGGSYVNPGIAVPVGEVAVRFYEQVTLKDLRIQGVWVNDGAHLLRAVRLVESRRYPFADIVTHRFGLADAGEALRASERREVLKAVLMPEAS